jgi:hypothetical protein
MNYVERFRVLNLCLFIYSQLLSSLQVSVSFLDNLWNCELHTNNLKEEFLASGNCAWLGSAQNS